MSEAAVDDLVVVKNVSRAYRVKGRTEPVVALRNLSLRIQRGSFTAIQGASGSGKSTLLHLLGGLDVPDSGRVVVDHQNLSKLSERDLTRYRSSKVGFVFQTFNLLPTLNARENVEFAMGPTGISKTERSGRSLELLKMVGMDRRAEHRPSQLSGGEQQRVGIARALANRPPLILADEPTGNLDRKSRDAVAHLLRGLTKEGKTTVVVVTHDPNIAHRCDVVYTIKYGRIGRQYHPDAEARARAEADADEEEPGEEVPLEESEGDAGSDDDD